MGSHLLILACLAGTVVASSGDRLPEFNDCVDQCVQNTCPRSLGALRLLGWDCPSECDYVCQQVLTDVHEEHGMRIHQYHGKWPFKRFMGVQEPASVLFSMLNWLPNFIGFKALYKERDSGGFHMRKYYLAFALVGMNTWLWSSVFHMRDLLVTERLDYFSAIGQILFGMFLALVRLFRLDLPEKSWQRYTVIAALSIFYAGHIYYLSCVRFNYAYNMLAGVIIGVSQTVLWIVLGLRLYIRTKSKIDLLPVVLVLSVLVGMSFELNDFSPYWRIIDAHSLWHLSTALPTYFWYRWMTHDLRWHEKASYIRKERYQF